MNQATNILEYIEAGLSVIPVKCDGTKAPALPAWAPYQKRIASDEELNNWFGNGKEVGNAIVCGNVSGGLEVLDFDDATLFAPFIERCKQAGISEAELGKCAIVKSPGGAHFYYRCPGAIEGNQKLAQRQDAGGKLQTLIETRGEGGYIIAPGSPPSCHPSGKEYVLKNGSLSNIPVISADVRQTLFDVASSFNEYFKEVFTPSESQPAQAASNWELRPGDDFNARADWWRDVLSPTGCRKLYSKGEESYLVKPGSSSCAPHATLNWQGIDKLYVFSSSFPGLEAERVYDKFQAYTYLFHSGNFTESTKALAVNGYGIPAKDSSKKSTEVSSKPAAEAHQDIDWTSPDSFGEMLPFDELEGRPISTDFLPQWVKGYVDAVAAHTQMDPGAAAALALAILAACIQMRFEVLCPSMHTEILSIWIFLALPPASRKSALLQALMAPVVEWEQEEAQRLRPAIEKEQTEIAIIKEQINVLTRLAGKAEE